MDFPARPSAPRGEPEPAGAELPAAGRQLPEPVAGGGGEGRPRASGRGARRPRRGGGGPARAPRRSETLSRVLWAVPWIVFAVAVIAVGGWPFAIAMALIAWATQTELFRMTARARPLQAAAYLSTGGMILAAHLGGFHQIVIAFAALFPLMLGFALARGSLANLTWSLAVTVLATAWIGLPFAHAVLLRDLDPHGGALLVDVLVATFFADTFAYLGGRMFGSRPLAPVVSPNKTIEGLAAGIAGGVLGFWLAGLYQDWLSGPDALLLGLCIAVLAPLGDLFESAIKRDLEVKDTGRLLGPHGGLLDRLDAVLFTVVAGYYLALLVL